MDETARSAVAMQTMRAVSEVQPGQALSHAGFHEPR